MERIEKFYPLPPQAVCNATTYGDFLNSLKKMSIAPLGSTNLTADSSIYCCDMYSEGLGYQFTVCDSGIGPYILNDRKGSDLDL